MTKNLKFIQIYRYTNGITNKSLLRRILSQVKIDYKILATHYSIFRL